MKVAVGYTKIECDHIVDSFAKGIIESGDEVIEIKTREDVYKIDMSMVRGNLDEKFRTNILTTLTKNKAIDTMYDEYDNPDFDELKRYTGF